MINLLAIMFVTVTLAVPPRTSHLVSGHIEGGRLIGIFVTEGDGVISFPHCDRTFTDFACHATSTDTVMPVIDFAVALDPMCQPTPARVVYRIDEGPPLVVEVGGTAAQLECVYLPVVSHG